MESAAVMPDLWPVAVVSSAGGAREVALVLTAIGIPSTVLPETPDRYVVGVAVGARAAAERALVAYVAENPPLPPAPSPRVLAPLAGRAAALFGLGEFLVAVAASRDAFGRAWVEAGVLDGPAFRAGEWWRPVTALTLHADAAHLAANLGFGALFLALAGRVYGWGLALALTLTAAVVAATVEAAGLPAGTVSLGASTAVFAALGLLAPVRWPPRRRVSARLARAAPLVAALALLGVLGAGDPRVDVTAHGLGFVAGLAIGWPWRSRPPAAAPVQRLAAATAVAVIVAAWAAALR